MDIFAFFILIFFEIDVKFTAAATTITTLPENYHQSDHRTVRVI